MQSIQQYCAETGRSLEASPPMAAAAQVLAFTEVEPWQRIESPDPAAIIFIAPTQHRDSFAPNALGTCMRIAPGIDTGEGLRWITETADELDKWNCVEDIAGEGDEELGAVRSQYRFLRGTYTAEPGEMATSSLLVGWSDSAATYIFQFVVTTWISEVATHEQALDCLRIGEWPAREIIEAMRG